MHQQNMEQYWQQLRNMGLNEETIELYKKQIEQSINMTNNFADQMNQFTHNMQQFNQLFTGDDAQDEQGEEELLFNDSSTLTPAEQWAIACGADVAFKNGQYLNDLATGLDKATCRHLLSTWWDIDSTQELNETLAWLKESGHRVEYDVICQALNTVSMKETKEFLRQYITSGQLNEEATMDHLRNTRDALECFREQGLIGAQEQPEMLIWDYARIINLSRAGFDAGYLTREQAMGYIMDCVPAIKNTYHSWQQLSLSYQFARCVWNGVDEDDFKGFRDNMNILLTDTRSPWVVLAW